MMVEFCEGLSEIVFAAGLNGFHKDCIQILVVENHDVLGAAAGGVQEATGLVAENPDGYGHCFSKHTMGSDIGIERNGRRRHGV